MLKASQRLVNKNSLTWWYVLKISLLDVLKIYLSYLQNVLKTSWRCLEDIFQDVLARRLEDVLKKFWRRLQNVLKMSSRCLGDVFARSLEDVFKMPWRLMAKTNISTSDQRCFNVVGQRWNNVDPTLKMKQNPTSHFQRCTTLIQRCLKQRCLKQRWYNLTLIQR